MLLLKMVPFPFLSELLLLLSYYPQEVFQQLTIFVFTSSFPYSDIYSPVALSLPLNQVPLILQIC